MEGCLSIPRIYGPVLRYPLVKARATVIDVSFFDGGRHEKRTVFIEGLIDMGGLAARVFQHELDHLNGILFTDHVLAQGNKLFREESKEMVEMEM